MAHRVLHGLVLTSILHICSSVLAAGQMSHIVYRYASPLITPGSFEATSSEVWRVELSHARIEEAPDPKQGIHGLIVFNAPNSWHINLYNRTAHHLLDPGPTLDVHFPIFLTSQNEQVLGLEFGQEVSFFRKHHARQIGSKTIDGVQTEVSSLTFEDTILTLYVRRDGKPYQISISGERNSYTVIYELYESGLEPDWALFEPPGNIAVYESEP